MKKHLLILLVLAALPLCLHAQTGLHIDQLFQGQIVVKDRTIETKVRGKALSKYGLTFFRSLKFEATAEECRRIETLVEKDRNALADSSQDYLIQEGRQTTTHILQLQPQGGNRRLLCYKRAGRQVLVIYMEGPSASYATLKKLTQ